MASKPIPNRTASFSLDEIKYKKKLKELRRKVRDIEEENDKLLVSLTRARRQAQRIRMERTFLQAKIQEWGEAGGPSGRELESSSESEDEEDVSLAARIAGQESSMTPAPSAPAPPTTSYVVPTNVPPINVGRAASASFPLAPKATGGKRYRKVTGAFTLFSKQQQANVTEEVAERNGDEGEVTRILEHRWKALSAEEKQAYIKESEALEKSEKKETPGAPATFGSIPAKPVSDASNGEKDKDEDDEEDESGDKDGDVVPVKHEKDEMTSMDPEVKSEPSSSHTAEIEADGDEEASSKDEQDQDQSLSPMEID